SSSTWRACGASSTKPARTSRRGGRSCSTRRSICGVASRWRSSATRRSRRRRSRASRSSTSRCSRSARRPSSRSAPTPTSLRSSQAVAVRNGSGPLYDALHTLVEGDGEPSAVHRFLARLPAVLRDGHSGQPLLVTTGYELALERALEEADESYDTVCYLAAGQ